MYVSHVSVAAVVKVTVAVATVVRYGCFNTMLEMRCMRQHVLVFESARYGRNDSTVNISKAK